MAASSGARNRGRSVLAATLVASASFMVVTVAAFQTDFTRKELGRDSGTGGFTLVGESDVPLLYDPSDADGRFELGFGGSDEKLLHFGLGERVISEVRVRWPSGAEEVVEGLSSGAVHRLRYTPAP